MFQSPFFRVHCTKAKMRGVNSPLDKTLSVLGWVGWDWIFVCRSHQNLESSDDGSVGMLSVLGADWSVVTKYRGVFDLMNINELSLSVTATVGHPLICRAGADQLLTSDINASFVTRTFMSASVPQAYRFLTFKPCSQNILKLLL